MEIQKSPQIQKYTKNTKYELCNSYKIQNKNLLWGNKTIFSIFSNACWHCWSIWYNKSLF